MQVDSSIKQTSFKAVSPKAASKTKVKAGQATSPGDAVEINWNGSRPAHRNVKKMARTIAGGIGVVGLGATAYKALSASTLGDGLMAAGIGLAATVATLTAFDIGSGLAHHAGDNYLNPNLPHTQWHTQPTDAEYCLVGFSNKALDAVEFWPKWEKAVNTVTGKEPISWKVPEYKAYCLGEISSEQLHQKQIESGMLKS